MERIRSMLRSQEFPRADELDERVLYPGDTRFDALEWSVSRSMAPFGSLLTLWPIAAISASLPLLARTTAQNRTLSELLLLRNQAKQL